MTANDRDTDGADETNRSGFIRTVLTDLFETIADMDERNQRRRSGTASARSGTSRFDYGFSIGIGPQADTERGDASETPPTLADTDHAATVHSTEEGAVVTVDLPDIDPTGLSAGVDSNAQVLSVAVDGEIIDRVALPRGDLEVGDASFNNGVLDVRLRATGESNE